MAGAAMEWDCRAVPMPDTHPLMQGRPLRWRLSDPLDRRGEVLAAGDAVAHSAALGILSDGASLAPSDRRLMPGA